MRVRKAVFPAAGWGTRFLPATKAQPKEMLPLVDKPIIQYAVEEAVAAGHRAGHHRHLEPEAGDRGPLRPLLRARAPARGEGRHRDAPPGPRRSATWPRSPTSARRSSSASGHAVLMAKDLIGHEPFAVILPDDVVVGDRPCIGQLIHAYHADPRLGRRRHGGPARGDQPLRRHRLRAVRATRSTTAGSTGSRGSSRSRHPATRRRTWRSSAATS